MTCRIITLLMGPLDGLHFYSPLPWGEGESSAVFRPYPRWSLPSQCTLNIAPGGGGSLSPRERAGVGGGSTATDCRSSKRLLGRVLKPLERSAPASTLE